jgi:hypothetical protein
MNKINKSRNAKRELLTRNLLGISLALALLANTGCSTTASLFPVKGPLSSIAPLPVILAKADGIWGNTGSISLTMPDGEMLTGRWSSVAPQQTTFSSVSAFSQGGMAGAWAQVFGNGFSVSNVPGVNKGEAMLTGKKGTVMQVEFVTGSGTANGNGVAKDNRGNVFKVIF